MDHPTLTVKENVNPVSQAVSTASCPSNINLQESDFVFIAGNLEARYLILQKKKASSIGPVYGANLK